MKNTYPAVLLLFVALSVWLIRCNLPVVEPITPADLPIAAFALNNNPCMAPCDPGFINQSTNATSYEWNFGDGSTSTEESPAYEYTTPGTYQATLTAINGTDTDTETLEVTIAATGSVMAGFTIQNDSCIAPCTVEFTNTSLGATSYQWDFGDGATSTQENPSHQYFNPGTYQVELSVSDGSNSDMLTQPVTIRIVADFSIQNDACQAPCTINFTNNSGGATSYQWDFGDGSTSTEESPNHEYTVAGTYNVQLTASGTSSSDQITKPVTISINTFSRSFGGFDDERGYDLMQTSDGGFAISGYTTSFGAGGQDLYVVKTDVNGIVEWTNTFGGTDHENGYSIIPAMFGSINGDYVICGSVAGSLYLIRIGSSGNTVWESALNTDEGREIVETSDGGYAIAGRHFVVGSSFEMGITKVNSNGAIQWEQTYGGGDYEDCNSLVVTPSGDYLLAGSTQSFGAGSSDAYLVKLSSTGALQWEQTYGSTGSDFISEIIPATNGGYVLVGGATGMGAGAQDVYLIKVDGNGSLEWEMVYGGFTDDVGEGIVAAHDGGYVLVGVTASFGAGGADLYLVKVDNGGNVEWEKTYGDSGFDYGYSIITTADGGYAVSGFTDSFGAGGQDVYLLKLDADGEIQP